MAKALNIDLNVNANTSLARQELSLLQNTLKQLTTASGEISRNLTTGMDLSKTIAQVSLLRALLQSATNVDTGVLNFTKLNLSIQQANTSLLDYGRTLNSLGPTGQKAFLQLATAVSKSEIPISLTNGMLKQFGTTMKNTLRWQASSMLLHGTVNAIQKAWNYAQKLDRSLTDIQIVTKQSDAQMAKFAENANKAARALSSTTTAYTDAALIYYQLGLNDKQVKERTDVTVKMANVTGRTAEKVSDQMTAIWNNFDNGSKSLEYYADVITALGAATASSSDEIATGLSKFAAVADTVGLSYENATAALATITATTRQSADSVGNGLKTLFSRLQSLSLGQTLEDGVNLTKYTKALNTVGVSALDAAGNLRSMDSILADLGERWGTLSTAQLNALAQTVGGVRLYVTFTALMDNYDFFKDNIQIAKNAAGELLKQADIYDKSWAAARKHVQASAEAIYSDLIDDKFFTKLTNGFSGALGVVDNFIDGIGGIKGALFAAGTAMATFGKKGTAAFFDNSINSIRTLFPSGVKALQDERTRVLEGYLNMLLRPTDLNGNELPLNYAMQQLGLVLARILPLLNEFAQNLNSYSLLLLLSNLNLLDTLTVRGESIVLTAEQVMTALTQLDNINTLLYNTVLPATKRHGVINIGANLINGGNFAANTPGGILSTGEGSYIRALTELLLSSLNGAADFSSQASQAELARLSKFFEDYNGFEIDNGKGGTVAASYALRNAATPEDWTRIIGSIRNSVAKSIENEIKDTSHGVTDAEIKDTKNLAMQAFNTRLSIYLNEEKNRRENKELDELAKKGFLTVPSNMSIGTGITEAASMLGGLGMGLSILKSGVSNLSNPNMSGTDKFLSLATSIGMATPMLTSVVKGAQKGGLLPLLSNMGTKMQDFGQKQITNKFFALPEDQIDNIYNTLYTSGSGTGSKVFNQMTQNASTKYLGSGIGMFRALSGVGGLLKGLSAAISSFATDTLGMSAQAGTSLAGAAVAAEIVGAVIVAKESIEFLSQSIETNAERITRFEDLVSAAEQNTLLANEKYSNLVNSLESYDKQIDLLNNIDENTLEYRLALLETNANARLIIAENNLINGEDYVYENGIYTINKDAQERILKQSLEKVVNANIYENAARADLGAARYLFAVTKADSIVENAGYQNINLLMKFGDANTVSKIDKFAKQYNLGSAERVADLINSGELESELMITSGAAASNLMLLTSIAEQMHDGRSISDLQKLMIDDLSDDIQTSEDLEKTASWGTDSFAVAMNTLFDFKNRYKKFIQEAEGISQDEAEARLREIETTSDYLSADRHGKLVILAQEIANMKTTIKARQILEALQEELKKAGIDSSVYENYTKLSFQQMQDTYGFNVDENNNLISVNANETAKKLENNIIKLYLNTLSDYYLKANELGLNALELPSNLNIEDMNSIVQTVTSFLNMFDNNAANNMFVQLSKGTKEFRKDVNALIGDNAIETLFNFSLSEGYLKQYEMFRASISEKGLFEDLYKSEDFKNSLNSLMDTFDEMGDIGASNVLKLAESSETLSHYLELSDVNAQGLADTIKAVAKGTISINEISSGLLQAFSAAGELETSLAETYLWIDNYEKGTSIDTIGNFFKGLENTWYKSMKNGNFIDEPLLNAMDAMLAPGMSNQWRVLAGNLVGSNKSISLITDELTNSEQFKGTWDVIEQFYKTGDLSSWFKGLLDAEGNNEAFTVDKYGKLWQIYDAENQAYALWSDLFHYDNGRVNVLSESDAKTFTEIYKTLEDFINAIAATDYGKQWSPEMLQAVANELAGKNAYVNLAWAKNGAARGLGNILLNRNTETGTIEEGSIFAENIRAYMDEYSALFQDMDSNEITEHLSEMLAGIGIDITKLTGLQITDLQTALKEGNGEDLIDALQNVTTSIVDLGKDFDRSTATYEELTNAYNNAANGNGGRGALRENIRAAGHNVGPSTGKEDRYIMYADEAQKYFENLGFTGDLINAMIQGALESGDLADVYHRTTELFKNEQGQWLTRTSVLSYSEWAKENNNGSYAEYAAAMEVYDQNANDEIALRKAEISSARSTLLAQLTLASVNGDTELANQIKLAIDLLDLEQKSLENIEQSTAATAAATETTAEQGETKGSGTGGLRLNADGTWTNDEGETFVQNEDGSFTNTKTGKSVTDLLVSQGVSTAPSTGTLPGTGGLPTGGLTREQYQRGADSGLNKRLTENWYAWNDYYEGTGRWVSTDGTVYEFNENETAVPVGNVNDPKFDPNKGLGGVNNGPPQAASGLNNHIPGFASGYQGPATVGELGPEMWIHNGLVDIVGLQGRETVWVNPSDTILTSGQTDRLLQGHKPGFASNYGGNSNSYTSTYFPNNGIGGWSKRGSGSSAKEDDDKWKDSWEPYHEISREVQRLTTDVENLNTEMERAFGIEKIQKMEDELELLDLRLLQETDYIAEAEAYIAEYALYLPDGTEVIDGVILNYDALLEKYLKDIYEAQEKRDKDKLEKLQREWLRIQTYEQHTDKLEERRLEQLNLLYLKSDLILQKLLYSIDQVNTSLEESDSLIDYLLAHMNEDMFKMSESIALLGDATDITIQKMELAKLSIQDYEDLLNDEYANDEEIINNIILERNNLLKLNLELEDLRDKVIKKLTYTIQEFGNELKKATKLLSNYNALIKNYTDLSELMGLSTINNTEQIDKLNDALKNNMGLNIQATKSQLETNQALIAQMEADFANDRTGRLREEYDDVYQKLIEEGQGLSVTLSNNLQSMLNFIVKEFETELDRALTSFQDQITKGFGTWDELTSAANSLKGAQDVNTKAYDRVYQLNTLIRDMDSYMNDMTSAKNHNSILKFQELIKKLKADNTDLSQEELDVLRAQFELMLALFDLEDAQNAKNQVRLQRDMNGNWGYVYTADEDAMAEAQLNVDDKLKAYLDAVTALQQVQGEYMGTVAELEIQEQELRNELNQLGHTDEDEERRALLLKLIAVIEEQLDMYKNNLLRMQDTLNEAVDSGHGYIQEIWDESNELFNASLGALPQMMLESIATTEEFFDVLSNAEIAFVDRTTAAKDAYMELYEEWAPYLEQFNNGLGDMAEQSLKAVTNLDALNELYLQEFTDAMEAAVKWEQEYGKQMENIVNLNLKFIDSLDKMINDLRGLNSMNYSVSFRRVTDDSEVSAMTSMDSGGYTGAWGTSGKIAMLHEKEQVFNAQDTLNLLTAALILRTIDASANSMAIGLNNMITPKIDGVTQQIDLTVNISASFPNAVNHFEIEEAFNNLTNKAMQYANRKNA